MLPHPVQGCVVPLKIFAYPKKQQIEITVYASNFALKWRKCYKKYILASRW
jgi:hypothetical protein